MISFSVRLCVVFSAFFTVESTLTPDGTVPLDCGSQQTFTCNVTWGGAVQWTISGLSGISVTRDSGLLAANHSRITTTDTSGITRSSTITIAGFTIADDGGTIWCINQGDGSVQGVASISVGTLTPSGTVSVDCGSSKTFTCDLTGITGNPNVGWTINNLAGINALGTGGFLTATNNDRINTTAINGTSTPTSTITIADFTMNDNNGVVQCINTVDVSVQGTATVSVATPLCPTNVNSELNDECTSVNVTWEQLDTLPVTFTTVNYCPTSSPNCVDSMNCTSPCTIDGLTSTEDHNFTVIPNNNCGNATGCQMVTPVRGFPMCPSDVTISWRDDMSAHVTWQLPSNTPLVTSTTVMYCLSPSNCRNMTCSVNPCNIIGLDSCLDYLLTVIPNNNCGSPNQCNNNTLSGGTPGVEVEISRMTGLPSNATITWQQIGSFPQVTYNIVTYCPTSSSDCGDSMNCTTNCTISGLDPRTRYNFTITPMSICGSGMAVIKMLDPVDTPEPPTRELPIVVIVVLIVAAIILVVLVVIIVIVVVICCMKKKHGVKACPWFKEKEKEKGGDGDVIYEDPEKNNDNIKMQSSPAYQTVSSVCGTKDDYYYSEVTDDFKMDPSPAYQTVS